MADAKEVDGLDHQELLDELTELYTRPPLLSNDVTSKRLAASTGLKRNTCQRKLCTNPDLVAVDVYDFDESRWVIAYRRA